MLFLFSVGFLNLDFFCYCGYTNKIIQAAKPTVFEKLPTLIPFKIYYDIRQPFYIVVPLSQQQTAWFRGAIIVIWIIILIVLVTNCVIFDCVYLLVFFD